MEAVRSFLWGWEMFFKSQLSANSHPTCHTQSLHQSLLSESFHGVVKDLTWRGVCFVDLCDLQTPLYLFLRSITPLIQGEQPVEAIDRVLAQLLILRSSLESLETDLDLWIDIWRGIFFHTSICTRPKLETEGSAQCWFAGLPGTSPLLPSHLL